MLLALVALSLAAAPAGSPASAPIDVAITIDDLPFAGPVAAGDTRAAAVARILSALQANKAPAAGFVVCNRREEEDSLQRELAHWAEAKVELGNKTHSNRAVDVRGAGQWLDDVDSCGRQLVAALGHPVRYFRYPFLRHGDSPASRTDAAAGLKKRGYQIAPVTIDTADWTLADPYLRALSDGDNGEAERIGKNYVAHLLTAARHYRDEANVQLGRPVKHVLVLRAHALAADWLKVALSALAKEGFRFVTLEAALEDPLYTMPEAYVGYVGLSDLYRVGPRAANRFQWDEQEREHLLLSNTRTVFKVNNEVTIRRDFPNTFRVEHALLGSRSNSLVAEMPDETLLFVGSPLDPPATRDLILWLRARLGNRKLIAINTHFHFEGGPGGTAALLEAGATVFGSDLTAKLIQDRATQSRQAFLTAHATKPAEKLRFENAPLLPPNKTFPLKKGMNLKFGSEQVQVIFPGATHSPDNVVVWFPTRSILFAGHAIAFPEMADRADSNLTTWPAAVNVMHKLNPRDIMTGEGPPSGQQVLAITRQEIAEAIKRTPKKP